MIEGRENHVSVSGFYRREMKRKRKEFMVMDILKQVYRRVWLALSGRLKPTKHGGLLELQDDVQTCGYEDVQVMWEMLHRTQSHHRRTQFPFCWRMRIFVWSTHTANHS